MFAAQTSDQLVLGLSLPEPSKFLYFKNFPKMSHFALTQ